jgi:class 3 adenylate cyclase
MDAAVLDRESRLRTLCHMRRCYSCNEPNAEAARFCSSCGARLETVASAVGARKTVTVVFADIVESTSLVERLEPETAQRVLDRFFDRMREVIERHGGRVEKFIGDAVMAVFGVPVLHEDDAERAVRAAGAMRDALERLNEELEATLGVAIQMRTGVATGEVVTGDPATGKAFVTGHAVNVAARLETAAAPGEVLVDASTHRRVRDTLATEPLGPVLLKGKTDAIEVHRLLAVDARDSGRLESEFVGRKPELDSLATLLFEVAHGPATRLVTVIGEAGVGKSRLVEEFLAAHSDDAAIVRGRCLPYGEGITYWPLKQAIAQAAGLRGDETADEARARIRGLLGSAHDAELVTERVAETIGIADAVPEHKGTQWAVRRLVEEAARERPLIVVLDDIQWAEDTFLDLVAYIVESAEATQMLVLCMARPELLDNRLAWASPGERTSLVFLQPLSDVDSGQLVESLLGGGALDVAARERIVEASDGLPLFVEEMVAMLVDEGALNRADGRWVAADLSRIAAPATIHALLAARLDQLEPAERAVLECGSVEGQVFHRNAVEFLSPENERSDVETRLAALVVKELVEPERSEFSTDVAYRFHHLLLRDVAYESLQKTQRALLHERFATWLDDQAGERASEYDEFVGYHLEQAARYEGDLRSGAPSGNVAERAGARLGRAGLRAYARGDWGATESLLGRALDLLPAEDGARAALEPKLADARLEIAPARTSRLRSMRCFWSWKFGHAWVVSHRDEHLVFRCTGCGRERGRTGSYVSKTDEPQARGSASDWWGGQGPGA